ncbi:phosphoglycerate kinase [Chrysiogenes arsenatis]|uniref:phosphoglycerate kinase n=1 Tax=Chrysiogenes arsenatis TaxID=309797 RepID=UPI0004006236|nr:phosphoglycerate kinase [Chrysiogenes arsenatis]
MRKKSVKEVSLAGKRVWTRVDFNVPVKDGVVTDATRIEAALSTIRYIVEQGGKVILASHFGRPKGERRDDMSLAPVAPLLSQILGQPVAFAPDCIGAEVDSMIAAMKNGDVVLLENTRFHKGEEKNDPTLSQQFAAQCDVYVNDAFGAAHRAHSSTAGICDYVQEKVCGFLMEQEIEYLGAKIAAADRPFVAILGGAKVSDKIPVIENLIPKVDAILIGGAMAYTFLAAQGVSTGKSMVEEDKKDLALQLLAKATAAGVTIGLPIDHVVGREFSEVTEKKMTADRAIGEGWMGLDIGPQTIKHYERLIGDAKTVLWNGPMGVFEWKSFSEGTYAVAHAMAANTQAITIVGGGDSVSAVNKSGTAAQMSHISTGGGASLELLEGKILPGVDCLNDK